MAFIKFEDVPESSENIGGKGFVLGQLTQKGFPVPPGAILTSMPSSETDWKEIFKWWNSIGSPNIAVRSSAIGEDSEEHSFAGQNTTYLNVSSESDIKQAVEKCFMSILGESSKTYRHFFTKKRPQQDQMNVVLQEMVNPKFSGVFFSIDPRGQAGEWIIELIEGLGEDLVSGRKTPVFITAENRAGITVDGLDTFNFEKVLKKGFEAKDILGYEVDMEWALDENLDFKLLQARPVTAMQSISNQVKVVEAELERLVKNYPDNPTWDGQTFAEWTGFPSYLTFSLWRNAFSPHFAFGDALKKIGYLSFVNADYSPKNSLLERVFGRAYVNLEKMSALYFGPIPYSLVAKPRPQLVFDFKKLNLETILRTPISMFNMVKVGFTLSTQRSKWIKECSSELAKFRSSKGSPLQPDVYSGFDNERLLSNFSKECDKFSKEYLLWPLILIILTESTMQSLSATLKSILGEKESKQKIREWMGKGLNTVTGEMNTEFQKACVDPLKRPFFMSKYGHRGPGELDLSNPRWIELGDSAFYDLDKNNIELKSDESVVEKDIMSLKSFKREIILQEWRLLKDMLELREKWKMELLKPYAQIRFMAREIAKRINGLGEIHWLRLSEIEKIDLAQGKIPVKLQTKINDRKMRFNVFKQYSFPEFVTVDEIESIIKGENAENRSVFDGEALSPGLAYGEVRVVENPSNEDPDSWPENTILVAENTDPGWTPLFARAKGVIVDKGGVLSHCAIVAREMNLPAVSRVRQCHRILKNGDNVWVDGNNGRISIDR